MADRHGYAGLSSGHFKFLAHHGELALLLDGWNEVSGAARRRLITELTGLERDFPLLSMAMSSRRTSINVPLPGRRVIVLPLSEDQQVTIAASIRGEDGVSVLDAAWRTSGLHELVTIPLYLRALMEVSTSGKLPETKEEVLNGMVEAHEAVPANAELFHRELSGDHRTYLVALAVAAQKSGSPTMSDNHARAAVTDAAKELLSAGLIGTVPNPVAVLDALVGSHLLVRDEGPLYAFQHQQLQEWFTSFDLEMRFLDAADDLCFEHPLVVEVLNDRGWGEVVLFACERMSRKDMASAKVAAKLVALLLGIDPTFAAQIISRSGPMVWEVARQSVERFARAWHKTGEADRAVGFMITSGQPVFADIVWPILSNDHALSAMRLVRRFNPAVLGDTMDREYLGLPKKAREMLAGGLAYDGDRDGIDAALRLALTEPEASIRHRVFEGLSFRLATRHLEDLLRGSGPELANEVARRGEINVVRDETLRADLIGRRKALADTETSPAFRLSRALRDLENDGGSEAVLRELKDPAYSFKDQGEHVLHDAWTKFPEEVATAMRWRVENGQELPFRPRQYLDGVMPTDEEPIASLVLDGHEEEWRCNPAAYLAGPATVRALVDRYLQAGREFRVGNPRTEASYRTVKVLKDQLVATRPSVLFEVLSYFGEGLLPGEINDLASIISRHGQGGDGEPWHLPAETKKIAIEVVNGWGRQILAQGASRHEMAGLTWAMRRVPDGSQVPVLADMLVAELAAYNAAKAAFEANRADRKALEQVQWPHGHEYRVILTTIGTAEAENVLVQHIMDPLFGSEAAIGLQVIWLQRNEPVAEDKFTQWPDFARAAENRTRDRSQTSDIAEVLVAAADKIQAEEGEKALSRIAWYMGAAVLLPHGDRATRFNEILAGDLPVRARLTLAQRMAVGGLVIPAETLMKGLGEKLAEFGDQTWIQDNDYYPVLNWIELLPLSDRPESLLEGLDMVTTKFDLPIWRVRELLASLHFLGESLRVELLRGLMTRYPELSEQYELYLVLKNPGEQTLDILVEIASRQNGDRSIDQLTRHDYREELFHTLSPAARDSLPARFAAATHPGAKAFLASILLASGDHQTFLALAQDQVGRDVIGRFGWFDRSSVVYNRKPIGADMSHYELVPRDLSVLRKGLFALTGSDNPETAAFATQILEQIDEERDKEGGFDPGPRHPDISSGRPWPNVSVEIQTLADNPPTGS
ncbi:NACHT domain-containing protein [Roseibium sp.]|uniref:NACHT domain-containing protein n=1 Tax=Roseibium sp. TaxID=1936156 RepID=UPI00391BE1CF